METLQVERSVIIQAQPERVWQAITRPENFSAWFGGRISFARLEPGEEMLFEVGGSSGPGTITTVEPNRRFAFTWTAEQGHPARTLVTFTLESIQEGTGVTVSEAGFEKLPEEVRQARLKSNSQGWSIQVKNLADYMAAGSNV